MNRNDEEARKRRAELVRWAMARGPMPAPEPPPPSRRELPTVSGATQHRPTTQQLVAPEPDAAMRNAALRWALSTKE